MTAQKKLIPGEKKIIVTHGKVKKDTNNYRHRQKYLQTDKILIAGTHQCNSSTRKKLIMQF